LHQQHFWVQDQTKKIGRAGPLNGEHFVSRLDTTLVSIETDTHPLDGLYYQPRGETRAQAMILHGNCMNFYTGAPKFLPPRLAELGIATLAFNRRGHDVIATLNSRASTGGAYQRIDEAIADSGYAEAWLRDRRDEAPIVIGHSNGGMLAVQHAAGRTDLPALILLSAHQGGSGMVPFASANGLLAQDRLPEFERMAREAVAAGQGGELMLLPGWWYAIAAESLVDNLDRLPATMDLAPRVSCPTLFIAGDQEPSEMYPAEAFVQQVSGPGAARIIQNCDHFYTDRFDAVTGEVTAWLRSTFPHLGDG
tara:strand:- start:798 stop:1721 length:924 start_codon:yes stop_codon:yes gene_type:complete